MQHFFKCYVYFVLEGYYYQKVIQKVFIKRYLSTTVFCSNKYSALLNEYETSLYSHL